MRDRGPGHKSPKKSPAYAGQVACGSREGGFSLMSLDRLKISARLRKTEHPRKTPADDPGLSIQRALAEHTTGPYGVLFNSQISPAYVAPRATAARTTLTTSTTSTGLPKNPPRASTGVSTIWSPSLCMIASCQKESTLKAPKFRTFCDVRRLCRHAGCQPAIMGKMDAVILPASGCDTNASVRVG